MEQSLANHCLLRQPLRASASSCFFWTVYAHLWLHRIWELSEESLLQLASRCPQTSSWLDHRLEMSTSFCSPSCRIRISASADERPFQRDAPWNCHVLVVGVWMLSVTFSSAVCIWAIRIINCVHSLFVWAIGHFLLCPTHFLEVILCVTLLADFTHCWTGSITMLPTTSTTCMCSCIGLWVFVSPVLLLHCMYTLFSFICHFFELLNWNFIHSVALSRVKSEPMSMSFSCTLADFVPNMIQSRTMSSSACPYSQSFTSSFNAVTNCWTVSPGSWILLCSLYLAKIGFDLGCM